VNAPWSCFKLMCVRVIMSWHHVFFTKKKARWRP
jgi:hypothetical protein